MAARAPAARDTTNRGYRRQGVANEAERALNDTKSGARARVEHPFLVIKRPLGFAKTCYRGLERIAHRLFVTGALANLYVVNRRPLRLA